MAVNFSELLNADRLRPLWKSGPRTSDAEAETKPKAVRSELDEDADESSETALDADKEIGAAPPETTQPESPSALLLKLELLLWIVLGPQAILLNIYMMPLQRVAAYLEGREYPPHPLQVALQTRNLPLLVYSLEDSFWGLLRNVKAVGR